MTTTYTINRDELIAIAYKDLGAVATSGTPSPSETLYAADKLNMMIKAWMAKGLQLWVIKKAILIPEKSKQMYLLGPTGDHCSTNMNMTKMRVAAMAADIIIEVDSTTSMIAGDNIGLLQDDGTIHWTTINSVTDSDTVVIDAGLISDSAIGHHVYFYTTKIDRPHELLEAYRRNQENTLDIPLRLMSRTDYYEQSKKDSEGVPVEYYYDPQMGDSQFFNWQVADSLFAKKSVFILNIKKPFDDLNIGTDDFEFPQEWLEAITNGLSYRVSRHVGRNIQDRLLLKAEADESLSEALEFDVEMAPITLEPDEEYS